MAAAGGKAGDWQAVAAANGIEDPLGSRPAAAHRRFSHRRRRVPAARRLPRALASTGRLTDARGDQRVRSRRRAHARREPRRPARRKPSSPQPIPPARAAPSPRSVGRPAPAALRATRAMPAANVTPLPARPPGRRSRSTERGNRGSRRRSWRWRSRTASTASAGPSSASATGAATTPRFQYFDRRTLEFGKPRQSSSSAATCPVRRQDHRASWPTSRTAARRRSACSPRTACRTCG